jgi:8-oxo-dGTP pyrophosphatase MutT (NUDIX family)
MSWKDLSSEYVILYRKENSAASDAKYQVLVGQKQAIYFEAIFQLLNGKRGERRSDSFRSLLQPIYNLVLEDDGSVPGHSKLGKRLHSTIMPQGGQWYFPGGRRSRIGGLATALREICCFDSNIADSLESTFSAMQPHVFQFQVGKWMGTFKAYDVDCLTSPMKPSLLETVDGFATRASACEARLQQDGLQKNQYRPLLEDARAVELHALQWVPLDEHMALFDPVNFDQTWVEQQARLYARLVCGLLDVEAGAVREQLVNAMREHLQPHLQPNEAMTAAAKDLRSHLSA